MYGGCSWVLGCVFFCFLLVSCFVGFRSDSILAWNFVFRVVGCFSIFDGGSVMKLFC